MQEVSISFRYEKECDVDLNFINFCWHQTITKLWAGLEGPLQSSETSFAVTARCV